MEAIVRRPPVSTKIAVAIDEISRWGASERRLLEGEIAVSYVGDGKGKKEFQIRIGRTLPDGNLATWNEAAPLCVSELQPDFRNALVEEILGKAREIFVDQTRFRKFQEELSRHLSGIDGRISQLSGNSILREDLAFGMGVDGGSIDLSAKKELVGKVVLSGIDLGSFSNRSGFLTAVPSAYWTYENTKNRLSADGYVVKNEISDFYTKNETSSSEQIQAALSGKADLSAIPEVPTDLSSFTNSPGYLTAVPEEYRTYSSTVSSLSDDGYLTEHQSLSNYWTKSETSSSSQISVALSEKADLSAIPLSTSQLANDSGFLTAHQSLSDYWTKNETSSAVQLSDEFERYQLSGNYLTSIPEEYRTYRATVSSLSNDGYLMEHQSLSDYWTKSETSSASQIQSMLLRKADISSIPEIPTDLSSFTNSPGYLTAHQSLSDYYTKSETSSSEEIQTGIQNRLLPEEVRISYDSETRTITLSSRDLTSQVPCDDFIKDGMLSSAELCGTVLWFEFNTSSGTNPISVELSDFVDNYDGKIAEISNDLGEKAYISAIPTDLSSFTNSPGYLMEVPETYKTYSETVDSLSNDGYLTSHQSLSDYWKKSETSSNVQISNALSGKADVSSIPEIPSDLSSFTNSPGYISEIPESYKTYDSTLSSLSDDGYVLSGRLASFVAISSLTAEFQKIEDPKASVNSVRDTLISVLTILKTL